MVPAWYNTKRYFLNETQLINHGFFLFSDLFYSPLHVSKSSPDQMLKTGLKKSANQIIWLDRYPFIIHGKLEFQSGSVRRPITTFWRVIKPNLELWICQKMLFRQNLVFSWSVMCFQDFKIAFLMEFWLCHAVSTFQTIFKYHTPKWKLALNVSYFFFKRTLYSCEYTQVHCAKI